VLAEMAVNNTSAFDELAAQAKHAIAAKMKEKKQAKASA
jgi:hypothetical protein